MPEQSDQEPGSILAVGLRDSAFAEDAQGCTVAETARSAIELMRMLRFDLVLTADRLPDMPVFQFVQRMRAAWPWQKWALVTRQLNERDEITARTLGVMRIIEGAVDWDAVGHLATTLHEQAESRLVLPRAGPQLLRSATSTG
jgi:DNA-binding NarL/FixJ family response regulator